MNKCSLSFFKTFCSFQTFLWVFSTNWALSTFFRGKHLPSGWRSINQPPFCQIPTHPALKNAIDPSISPKFHQGFTNLRFCLKLWCGWKKVGPKIFSQNGGLTSWWWFTHGKSQSVTKITKKKKSKSKQQCPSLTIAHQKKFDAPRRRNTTIPWWLPQTVPAAGRNSAGSWLFRYRWREGKKVSKRLTNTLDMTFH